MEDFLETSNINQKWLNNIYENIKNLEDYERLVREGCKSLLDFMNIPYSSRPVLVGITQFKNLKFLITEFRLLLADLTPVLEKTEDKKAMVSKLDEFLKSLDKSLKNEDLFISYSYNEENKLIQTETTPFFYETIDALHAAKVDLFREIKHILYINS